MKAILFGEKKKNVNNIIIIKILQRVQRTDDKKKKEKGQRDKEGTKQQKTHLIITHTDTRHHTAGRSALPED
jgi:hypothetical protein